MGRGKARGGRRGGASAAPQTQTQAVVEKANPLTQLIASLLDQAYTALPEAERPKADKKSIAVAELEKTTKLIVSSEHTETKQLVVSLSLALSLNSVLSSPNAKKVLGIVFTYLIGEVTRYWSQYGLTKDQVHPSLVRFSF